MTLKTLIPLLLLLALPAATAAQDASQDQSEPDAQAQAEAEIEAAATNATLAMRLCLQNHREPDALLQAFQQAGFTYAPEDLGDGEVLHGFATPDSGVGATVIANEGAVECRIGTGLWGVEAMLPFARDAFDTLTDAVEVQDGGPEGQTILPGTPEAQEDACSGFHAMLPQSMLWVQILHLGNDGTCASDGTSVMRMIF